MKIPFEQFKSEVETLEQKIKYYFDQKQTPGHAFLSDGIINLEDYYRAPTRIMWVLKEPYCDKKGGGGGWSLTQDLNARRALGKDKGAHTTWHPIIYASYGILNGYMNFDQIPKVNQDAAVSLVLRQIAFVNLKKMPGRTRTKRVTLEGLPDDERRFVVEQIETYRPHIVIGGRTLHLLKSDLGITKGDELAYGHFQKNGTLFLHMYHPAQTRKTMEEYVNKIIERSNQWQGVYQQSGLV